MEPSSYYQNFIAILVISLTITTNNTQGQNSNKFSLLQNCLASKGIDVQTQLIRRDLTSAKYVDSNFQYNQCCGGLITPMSYLTVTDTSKVQAAVICCKQLNIRIVPKSGGHSYGKYSFGDSESLVLDFRPMKSVIVDKDKKVATVGAGTLIGPMAYKLYKQDGFGVPIGECVIIGVTSALGGGYGQFSRLRGLTSDNLLALEMVDANGQRLIANNVTNPDLFWALRGAGAGSYGIVTKYIFKLFDMPNVVVYGIVEYCISEFPQVFEAHQRYLLSNPPRTINPFMKIPHQSATGERKIVVYIFQHQTAAEAIRIGEKEVRNILATKFPRPRNGSIKIESMGPIDFIVKFGHENGLRTDNITNSDQLEHLTGYDYHSRAVVRVKSIMVPKKTGILGPLGILELHKLLMLMPAEYVYINFHSFGGAINDLKSTDTAYVHRDHILYELQPKFIGTNQQLNSALSWLRLFFEKTKILMRHTESFQNHLDIDLPDYLERYYGQNIQHLVEVKRKYDPENIFNHPRSIPTKYSATGIPIPGIVYPLNL